MGEIVNNGSLGNFTVDKSFTVCERNETTGDCKVRPKSHKVCVYSALKIDQPFTEELNNKSSAEFIQLEQEFCTEMKNSLREMKDVECEVTGVRNGSIIVDFLLEIPYQDYQGSSLNKEDVLNQIKEIVNDGSLGNFTVDK